MKWCKDYFENKVKLTLKNNGYSVSHVKMMYVNTKSKPLNPWIFKLSGQDSTTIKRTKW